MKIVISIFTCLLFTVISMAQCHLDRHSTLLEDSWQSCEPNLSPNPNRGESHWIMYDLSDVHILGQTHFWNINTPELTDMGAKTISIDLSRDGISWESFGEFELEQATPSSFYEGQAGPDLQSMEARYILITILENYGNPCYGLAEIRFESLGLSTGVESTDLAQEGLQIHPNPAKDFTILEFDAVRDMDIMLSIADMSGKEIQRQRHRVLQGLNTIRVDLYDISAGNYVIKIESGSSHASTQLSIINK